ncbi:MAG: hypothetical protein ACFFE5_15605 [Candidatus Thorarchaeota archaeon]
MVNKLTGLKKHQVIGMVLIIIGIGIFISQFFIIPLINTERKWTSDPCYLEPWYCSPQYFELPQNIFSQNKYLVIVFNSNHGYRTGSISFNNLDNSGYYTFNYYLSIEDYTASIILTMNPGRYSAMGDFSSSIYYLWELGILPKDFDFWAYLGLSLFSIVIIFIGIKAFQGFDRYYELEDEQNFKEIWKKSLRNLKNYYFN